MESLDNFKKRCESIIDKAYQGGVTLLGFLDDAEIGILEALIRKHPSLYLYSDGGIINSDRKRYLLTPYEDTNIDYKICIYEIIYNKKYYEINHRSILGSLMSLGIKRECIGDIVINEQGAYFAATKEISPFLLNEFKGVGKAIIELKEVNYDVYNIIKYESKTYFLSSLRLDSVIAEGFKMSRSEAQEMITNGLVYINHILCQNNSHIVKLEDIISVRHKGKIKLMEIGGSSKSGRIAVTIGRRI